MIQEGPGHEEAARIYEAQGHDRIQSWERIYLGEGPIGLSIERRAFRPGGVRCISRQPSAICPVLPSGAPLAGRMVKQERGEREDGRPADARLQARASILD